MRFIGANDTSTLEGVLEEIDWFIAAETRNEQTRKLARDKYAARVTIATLKSLRGYIEMAIPNGPTPDLSQLSEMKLVLAPETRARLLADEIKDAQEENV